MSLYESKREKLLNFLKLGLNPFKNFVSTGELKEELGLVKSRNDLFEKIKNRLENEKSLILPLIGDVGVGKTYLYWHFKNNLYFYNTIYASLETLKSRFFYKMN
jgi:DNA replication protein DnaC